VAKELSVAVAFCSFVTWNFGHVEPGLLPDGSVFVAFYAGDAQSLSVRWVRLAV